MPNNIQPARKQRRGEKTRHQLLQATKSLLADYDYQSITLDQVADTVGVAKSSILWHFGSKEGLLTEAVFELFEEIDQAINLEKHALSTLDERMAYLLEMVAEYFTNHPQAKGIALSLVFNGQTPQSIQDRIREQWQEHIDEIVEFLSTDDERIDRKDGAAIMAMIHGCYLQWYLAGKPEDLHERMRETCGRFPIKGGARSTSKKRN